MKAIVTTSYSVLVFDTSSETAFAIDRGRGLYYGITRTPNGICVAARRRLVSSTLPVSEEKGCLVFFPNGQENYTVEAPFALRDLHGIAYVNDSLWATCCFDNQIAI